MMTVKPARKSKSQGQALVEFGLILPVLLLIVTGIIDFGQVAITYVQSLSALRNAARFAEVAGFATVPGAPVRYLDCDGMIDAANDILFAGNQNIDITYYKADAYPTTTYDCDTVTSDVLRNGDILEIVSSARVQFITPFVSGIVPDLNIQFTARRTIVKSILLGSDDAVDTDYDGLLDEWELKWFGDLSAIATGDPDGDGCNNGCEEARVTCPIQTGSTVDCGIHDSKDSDGDRLDDADEAYLYDTDGTDTDTDDDGLTDYDEVIIHKTDPNVVDTDEEGLGDGEEIAGIYAHLAPTVYQTEPLNPDTDADTISDYDEVHTYETNPLVDDTDGDTLLDADEINVHDTDPNLTDTDGDSLTDPYEVNTVHAGGFKTLANNKDTDGEGLWDGPELNLHGTKPWAIDSDGDRLTDYDEIMLRGSNPNDTDTDNDNLLDGDEVEVYLTDPNKDDTDDDTVKDGDEVACGTSPVMPETTPGTPDSTICSGGSSIDPDTDDDGLADQWEMTMFGHLNFDATHDPDGDGLNNENERNFGTHANLYDMDSDGRSDGEEIFGIGGPASNPKNPDTDGDGLSDGQEVSVYGTNPNLVDTDGDTLSDPAELSTHGTSPILWDTDADALGDGQEIQYQTNPNNVDSDGEGLWDGEEVNVRGTNPLVQDTDGDGLNDYAEVYTHSTNPTLADTDGEGLTDGVEVNQYGTNPNKSDTDGDTLSDYAELFAFPSEPMKTTDPLVADTDLDGKRDDFELANGTMPNNPIAISVLPASVTQGNKATTLKFTIQLDRSSSETTTVRFRTADGTPPNAATASSGDYNPISSTEITFLPGTTSQEISVTIGKEGHGQNVELADEHFFILLSDNDNAYINTSQAKMTILYSR